MSDWEIRLDDPRRTDVAALIAHHLSVNLAQSGPEDCHTLGVDDLCDPAVLFFSCRCGAQLLGIGALVDLGDRHGEFKSMHTVADHRRKGVARAMVLRLLDEARARGFERISLETGATASYLAARELYLSAGFTRCAPFADYAESSESVYLTRAVDRVRAPS